MQAKKKATGSKTKKKTAAKKKASTRKSSAKKASTAKATTKRAKVRSTKTKTVTKRPTAKAKKPSVRTKSPPARKNTPKEIEPVEVSEPTKPEPLHFELAREPARGGSRDGANHSKPEVQLQKQHIQTTRSPGGRHTIRGH